MFVGVGRFDVLLPPSSSLKQKRKFVRPLLAHLHHTFEVSAAETDYLDLLARAEVSVAVVANEPSHCREVLVKCEQVFQTRPEYELLASRLRVFSDEDFERGYDL